MSVRLSVLFSFLFFCFVLVGSGLKFESLRRLCVYTCLSVHRGWYPGMPCRWYPSMSCRSPGGMLSQHTLQVFKGGL